MPDKKKNRYVLIIQPNDGNYKQYTITINAKGFKQGQINSVVVKAGLSTGYVINPKHGANKNVDPLYVEGWSIYKNGKRLGDNEIRSLFANTPAYGQYEKGLGIYESTLWNKDDRWGLPTSKGLAYTFLACGGTMVILGYSFASLSDDENDVESMKKFGAAGLVATGIGCGLFLIRTSVLASGKAKIRKAVNIYNNQGMYSQSDVKMEYGLTGNGVYFSLLF